MTLEETAKILAALKGAGYAIQDDELTAGTWHAILGDLPYSAVLQATHLHMRQSKYPPNTGSLREIIVGREELVPIPATDVWGRTILREDGTPSVERWERRRVGGLLPEGHPALAGSTSNPMADLYDELKRQVRLNGPPREGSRSHVGDVLNGLTRGLGD